MSGVPPGAVTPAAAWMKRVWACVLAGLSAHAERVNARTATAMNGPAKRATIARLSHAWPMVLRA